MGVIKLYLTTQQHQTKKTLNTSYSLVLNSQSTKNVFYHQQHSYHAHEQRLYSQRKFSDLSHLGCRDNLSPRPPYKKIDVGFLPGKLSTTTVKRVENNQSSQNDSSFHVYDHPPDNSKKRPLSHLATFTTCKRQKSTECSLLFPSLDLGSISFDVDSTSKILDDNEVFEEFSLFTAYSSFPLSPPLSPTTTSIENVDDLVLFP